MIPYFKGWFLSGAFLHSSSAYLPEGKWLALRVSNYNSAFRNPWSRRIWPDIKRIEEPFSFPSNYRACDAAAAAQASLGPRMCMSSPREAGLAMVLDDESDPFQGA